MTKQEAPLRDVLKDAKNELDEARRELERAREQIQTQRQGLQQELDSLLKLRDQAAAEKTAVEKLSEEFRGDWGSLQAGLLTFSQTAQELQKRQENVVQLIRSKDDDLKAALKNINESIIPFKDLAAELTRTLEELQSDQARFESTAGELDQEIRETATGSRHADELLKSIGHGLKQNQERLRQLSDVASKIQASISSAGAGVQEIEGCFKATGDASEKLASTLSEIGKSAELVSTLLSSGTKRLQEIQEKQTGLNEAALNTQKLIKDVEGVSRSFGDTSNVILERVQAQERLLSELGQAANETQTTIGSTGAIGQEIEKSIGRDIDASRQLRESLASLHGTAQTLSDQMDSLAERLRDVKAKDQEELKGVSESLRQDFDKFAASMNLVIDGFDAELERARVSRAQIVDALGRARQELATSLGAIDRLSKESTKEYAEAAGLLAATIKEVDAQRDELNASAQRLKATAEQLQAERMALDERLGELRAEREKRAAARKKGVCPSCGRRVGPTDTFCDRCGESLV